MSKISQNILRRMTVKRAIAIAGTVAVVVLFLGWSPSVADQPDLEPLKGRWMRPDGGYVIEIEAIGEDGKLTAAYFNPRPIRVEKAEARQKEGKTEVFIKLQDINYPGSTYRLIYNAEKDVLEGVYFQAAERREFEIYFERVKEFLLNNACLKRADSEMPCFGQAIGLVCDLNGGYCFILRIKRCFAKANNSA